MDELIQKETVKTKKRSRRFVWIFLMPTLIVIINFGYSAYLNLGLQVYNYGSLNSEFTYDCIPQKGRDLNRMFSALNAYDQANGTRTEICRKFPKNYLKFWLWLEYTVNPYYKFPKC